MAFCTCPTGSNYFYDQLVPKHVNIVQDKRFYDTTVDTDFSRLKAKLNHFHSRLYSEGTDSGLIENFGPVTVITRRSAQFETKCVAYSCYRSQNDPQRLELTLCGTETKVLFEAVLKNHKLENFTPDDSIVNGVTANYRQGSY